jgi:uncharacterized membrane protein YqjE
VHPIRAPEPVPAEPEGVVSLLTRLVRLELELGLAETRALVISAVVAIGVALVAAVTLLASLVVLIAGALAPLFGARWPHLVIAGGGVALLALAAVGWSVWRLKTLDWPQQTLRSFEENWRWLEAQLRSRLTLR